MARRVPKQSHTRQSNPSNCWWTETGWLCCTSDNSPWPSCIAGGLTTQQRGYGPQPPPGSYAAAVAAGAVAGDNRRAPIRRASNPMPDDAVPVVASPMANGGASSYVVAPNGAYPGATAWLYIAGVPQPMMVTIDAIFNTTEGIFATSSPRIASTLAFGPSQTGGFGEVLAPYSQGGSVRTTAGSPVRSSNPVEGWGGNWIPATFFDGPPFPNARRWVKLLRLGPSFPGVPPGSSPALPGDSVPLYPIYDAILFKDWGANQEDVAVVVKTTPLASGGSRVDAKLLKPWDGTSADPIPPGAPPRRRTYGLVSNPPPGSLIRLLNPGAGTDNYSAEARVAASGQCMVDLASLTLHCPGSPLHGLAVTDIEPVGRERNQHHPGKALMIAQPERRNAAEGELVAVSYVDPSTGMETIGEFMVAPDQGVPWWEHDGHCCESCTLGAECDDCDDERSVA